MYGKVMKIIGRDISAGINDREVLVFACFKELKYNNCYVLFADTGEFNGKLYYGSVHFKGKNIVIIDTKKKLNDIINDFITVIIQKKKLYDYQIINIDSYEKIELISNNEMNIEEDIFKKMDLICIKKKPKVKKETKEVNKFLVVLLLLISLFVAFLYFYYENKDNYKLECTKDYEIEELSKVHEEVIVYFDKNDDIIFVDSSVKYIFDTKVEYQEFKTNTKLQNKYIEKADGLKFIDDENTVVALLRNNSLENTYSEMEKMYTSNDYTCSKVMTREK